MRDWTSAAGRRARFVTAAGGAAPPDVAGPPDPRTVARLALRHHTAVVLEDLRELAVAAGPLAAAAALAAVPDAGAVGYAMLLQRLVEAAPPATVTRQSSPAGRGQLC